MVGTIVGRVIGLAIIDDKTPSASRTSIFTIVTLFKIAGKRLGEGQKAEILGYALDSLRITRGLLLGHL